MKLIAIVGPTASSKSDAAVAVAEHLDAEIISVDSMQVYRGLDIGTAKASAELQARVPHHMIDLCEPEHDFSVAEFQEEGRRVLADLADRGRPGVIVGGSGLHFRALVDPLEFPPTDSELRTGLEATDLAVLVAELLRADPGAGDHVDLANPRRVVRAVEIHRLTGEIPSRRAVTERGRAVRSYQAEIPFLAVGLDPGPALASRVGGRMDGMLEAGLLDEVRTLAPRLGVTACQAVGYKEFLPVVAGGADPTVARLEAIAATMALAKRQRTFFGRDPRIEWISWQDDVTKRNEAVLEFLEAEWTS